MLPRSRVSETKHRKAKREWEISLTLDVLRRHLEGGRPGEATRRQILEFGEVRRGLDDFSDVGVRLAGRVIVGLIDRGSSRFQAKLHRRTREKPSQEIEIATRPGSLIVFCGHKLWHAVSALGQDEERVVLSLSYVTEGKHAKGGWRLWENVKDAVLHFGPSYAAKRNYDNDSGHE